MAEDFISRLRAFDEKGKAFTSKFQFVVGLLVIFCFVGAIVVGGWQELDKMGWVRHSADTPVSINGEWLQGEYRSCLGVLGTTGEQKSLTCITDSFNAPEHVLPVAFWGRLERKERMRITADGAYLSPDVALDWKCQRLSDSLKCWAQN
jgi:hypothetical protein